MLKGFLLTMAAATALTAPAAVTTMIRRRNLHLWLYPWARQAFFGSLDTAADAADRHIILSVCDHFDFGSRGDYVPGEESILSEWEAGFPALADRHRDSCGCTLKHTWFFPPHYHRNDYLKRLVNLCNRGYGEIEMHLHHDHMPPFPDTSATLRKKIRDTVAEYSRYGVFTLPDGRRTFGFIHGDWALDNSRGGRFCGVNDEISILAEEGCYADFTFPSLHEAQPEKINSVYYVTDDRNRPKSYNRGEDVVVGGHGRGDLLMVQGPLWLGRKRKYGLPLFPAVEAAELQGNSRPTAARADNWLKANVHVKGRPEWIFVKLHTHGAMRENFEHNIGRMADEFFTQMEDRYVRGREGHLHYVTARETYNIIKAAEAGKHGNPSDFRDFLIPRYVYLQGDH